MVIKWWLFCLQYLFSCPNFTGVREILKHLTRT
nr:MAG TPA: hypothetical protein [Caudoviricetes sp.]